VLVNRPEFWRHFGDATVSRDSAVRTHRAEDVEREQSIQANQEAAIADAMTRTEVGDESGDG